MIDSKTIFIAKYLKSIIKKAIQKVERLKDHHSNSNRKNNKVEFLTDFDDRESVFIDFLKNISKNKFICQLEKNTYVTYINKNEIDI